MLSELHSNRLIFLSVMQENKRSFFSETRCIVCHGALQLRYRSVGRRDSLCGVLPWQVSSCIRSSAVCVGPTYNESSDVVEDTTAAADDDDDDDADDVITCVDVDTGSSRYQWTQG